LLLLYEWVTALAVTKWVD